MKMFQEYAKLAMVAVIASALTAFVMRANEPQAVHAAGSASLPTVFAKDAKITGTASSAVGSATSGKILNVQGTWVEFSDGNETWWADVNNPMIYYQVSK